jgi:hypothetical protein
LRVRGHCALMQCGEAYLTVPRYTRPHRSSRPAHSALQAVPPTPEEQRRPRPAPYVQRPHRPTGACRQPVVEERIPSRRSPAPAVHLPLHARKVLRRCPARYRRALLLCCPAQQQGAPHILEAEEGDTESSLRHPPLGRRRRQGHRLDALWQQQRSQQRWRHLWRCRTAAAVPCAACCLAVELRRRACWRRPAGVSLHMHLIRERY